MKKIKLKEKINFKGLSNKIKANDLSLRHMLLNLSLILVIIVISYNIFLAYNRGVQNQAKLMEEEAKLARLQQENVELNEKENYFRSIEYRKAYARESLNLAGEGERLYYVVRDEKELEITDETNLYDKDSLKPLEHWRILILGN